MTASRGLQKKHVYSTGLTDADREYANMLLAYSASLEIKRQRLEDFEELYWVEDPFNRKGEEGEQGPIAQGIEQRVSTARA